MDIMQILWSYLLRSKKSKECESNLPHSEQKGSQILNRLQNGNYKPAPSDCTGSDANGYSHRNNHIRYGPSPWGSVQLCRAHCRIRFRHKRRQAHPTLPGDQCRGGEGGEGSSSFLLSKQMRFRGAVAEGYGRGGKKLGFPTANLPSSLFADALSAVDTGVYFGWAVVEGSDDGDGEVSSRGHGVPQKAVVNVGYSPTFEGSENAEKIIEAHLMPDEGEGISDFYGNVMRLSLIGFLRSEKKFDSFPDLIAAINNDVECAKNLLDEEAFASFKTEKFVSDVAVGWVGPDGGDEMASWQIQDMQDA